MSSHWKYLADQELFACVEPGCSYSNASPNAVQLHHVRAHAKGTAAGAAAAKTTEKVVTKTVERAAAKRQGHQHDWQLLNRRIPSHDAAFRDGYKEVCGSCRALR